MRIFLLMFALGFPILCCLAGSQYEGWSADEKALASSLGLDLTFKAGRFRVRPIGEQTWLSPWVVEAEVLRIDNEPESYYRTKVRVEVRKYLKGQGPEKITLGFAYGLGYSADRKAMTNRSQIPSVIFSKDDIGKRYILFLNPGRILLPNGEELYPRGKDEFNVANRYWIKEGKAVPDVDAGPEAKTYEYEVLISEIRRVAIPQSALVQSKP